MTLPASSSKNQNKHARRAHVPLYIFQSFQHIPFSIKNMPTLLLSLRVPRYALIFFPRCLRMISVHILPQSGSGLHAK